MRPSIEPPFRAIAVEGLPPLTVEPLIVSVNAHEVQDRFSKVWDKPHDSEPELDVSQTGSVPALVGP
jgi:hypothetical protein